MPKKDRYIWLASGIFAFAILIAVAFVPTALAQPDTTDTEDYVQIFEDVFRYIKENYVEEVDPQTLFEGAKVQFEIEKSEKGLKAVQVSIV